MTYEQRIDLVEVLVLLELQLGNSASSNLARQLGIEHWCRRRADQHLDGMSKTQI